ncbi:competence/damage-inducible protein A [Halobacterium wangiae]|uniref:competence/damage-inducible protein A n=1 Tax=Halobacterium wangiae TaxID=2902623 RepID=UPI001E3BD6BE|nr:molybdopterin-binding protein [Halobacterium wangiae]
MQVALITVGDELLAGDTENTNATWLATRLTERGASVERVVVVPDDVDAISTEVSRLAATYDAVLVTGGVGPTHDDVTMDAVAAAFDRELAEHPDAIAYFEDHGSYEYADLTEGTTHLPAGARLLENSVGVAPGAVVENVYVLPGVPVEMQAMFDAVAEEFSGPGTHVEFVTVDAPESSLLSAVQDLRDRYDVTVGSYPGDEVRVKIQHEDPDIAHEAATWFEDRVQR